MAGGGGAPPQAADRPERIAVAVVAHVYYEDTWPDIAGALRSLTIPFDLIVTTVAGRERLIETIGQAYPRAEIEIVENRGRDVGPFMALLERGRLDRYRYICKIHGKKSIDGGRKSLYGRDVAPPAAVRPLGGAGAARRGNRHVRARPVDRDDRSESVPIAEGRLSRGSLLVGQSPDDA